jgi:hypothetical protein
MSRLSTKAWIQDQQQGKTQLEFNRLAAKNLGVRMRTKKPRMMNVELSHMDNHLHTKSQTHEFHDNLGAILQESTAAKAEKSPTLLPLSDEETSSQRMQNKCTKDKCTKCGSDRHLEMLHMEKKNQQSRVKWKERRHNLEIGDIVIMTEENHHNNWPLARVINTFQSQDGKVRKVDVITWKNGEKKSYLRPISNIVFLMSTKQ